ncbi:MAG: hypothetical protein ACREJM_00960, partial [Candidatus Saccharimonadales bacterium]
FQDIITSVTGIMILVTLLMALELSQRVLQSPKVQTMVVSHDLKQAIAAAEAAAAALQTQLAARDERLQQLAGLDERRLRADTQDVERQISQLDSETATLAARAERAEKRKQQLAADSQARQSDVARAAQLTERIAQVEAQLAKLKSSNRVLYNPAQGSSKSAWLVELTDSELRAAPLGKAQPPTVFSGATPAARLAAFKKWSEARDRGAEYFVLVIKPSGVLLFEQLYEVLLDSGFDLGFDVVDSSQMVLDPTTGAGV